MTDAEAPETLEGWYVQHDIYTVKWDQWQALPLAKRENIIKSSAAWLQEQATPQYGSSAYFSLVGQKGDLLLMHFRSSLEGLNGVKFGLRQLELFNYLKPSYGYLSAIELGMYEIVGAVQRKLLAAGLEMGSETYEAVYKEEIEAQKVTLADRLYPPIPPGRYQCFYPMNKKRGETNNWYTLPMVERRQLMRGHGMVGRRYAGRVQQIVSGSVGLDDWEWGVSLFADDPLIFKKLVYEMRFDSASSLYGEFGAFFVGIRFEPSDIGALLSGTIPTQVIL